MNKVETYGGVVELDTRVTNLTTTNFTKDKIMEQPLMLQSDCVNCKFYEQINLVGDYQVKTIVYQGCEYVVMESHFYKRSVITHKGNCRFCKERRQMELKELVEQLKEK